VGGAGGNGLFFGQGGGGGGGSFVWDPSSLSAQPTLSIPEPSTWAMALVGFAGLGYAGYRQAKLKRA
jgi:hypothetical protein